MRNWKNFLVAGLTVAMTFGLMACSGGDKGESGKKGDTTKIQIAVSGSAEELKLRENIAKLYTDKHPEVEVEWVDLGNDRMQKLMALIGSGQAPDIMYVNEYYYYPLAERGVLESLDTYVDKDTEFDISRFNTSLIDDFAVYKDEIYGLPQEVSPFVIYYNKDMFNAAGVPLPTDDWTVEDFEKAAVALTNKDQKVYGYLHPSYWSQQAAGWFYREGCEVFSEDGTALTLDTPEALKALQTLNDLVVKEKVSPDPAEVTAMGDDAYAALFRNQKAAMYTAGAWDLTTYAATPLDFDWDVAMPPKAENQKTAATSLLWSISKDSKNKDIAWDILKTFTSPEAEKMIAEFHMAIPSTNDQEVMDTFMNVGGPENLEVFAKTGEGWSLGVDKSPKTKEVMDVVLEQIDLMLLGRQTPEETQANYMEKCESILK